MVVAGSVPPQKMQNGLPFNKARFDFLRWDASPMPFPQCGCDLNLAHAAQVLTKTDALAALY
jgi:hypothetical protein